MENLNLAWGARGREFESRHADHKNQRLTAHKAVSRFSLRLPSAQMPTPVPTPQCFTSACPYRTSFATAPRTPLLKSQIGTRPLRSLKPFGLHNAHCGTARPVAHPFAWCPVCASRPVGFHNGRYAKCPTLGTSNGYSRAPRPLARPTPGLHPCFVGGRGTWANKCSPGSRPGTMGTPPRRR